MLIFNVLCLKAESSKNEAAHGDGDDDDDDQINRFIWAE